MDTKRFIEDVESIDWSIYKYNEYHNPQSISKALIALALVDKEENENKGVVLAPGVYNSVLFAIGNNHAGTYYPVAQEALCFILQVALHGNSEISRNCAINILWELFFFVPENGADELEEIVKREIANHKDEFLKLSYIDNKNSILLNEFVETISEIQSKNEHRR